MRYLDTRTGKEVYKIDDSFYDSKDPKKKYGYMFGQVCLITSDYSYSYIKELDNLKDYDYKKNLEHLRERYLNKIKWQEDRLNQVNRDNSFGVIEGLQMAIHDIDDMLNELDV